MEGQEGSTSAAAAVHSAPPSPPKDVGSYSPPEGSPDQDVAVPEIHALPSDDEHGHDDHEHGLDQSGEACVLTEDLKQKIVKQVEYYFSDENLPTDKYMMGFIKKNKEGFVPIAVVASFRKMKKLIRDYSLIADALRESSLLVVSSNGKKVKRLHPLPPTEARDPKFYTVLAEHIPEDHSVENIQRIFSVAGNIKKISVHDPRTIEESTKGSKPDILISNKLHALVEYETVEAAEKAVATLNNEADWRNGMRVKLLNRMGKYGQKRQGWKGHDSEKNNVSRGSDHTGDEENHNLNEHHDEIPDEEEGEKNGHKGRNRGRGRRHSYRGINGLGHGNSSSSHAIEASKPPPGPKMPDGTRGFAMGRGRPPISNQSQPVL